MKRVLSMILTAVLSLSLLAGCGKKEAAKTGTTPEVQKDTPKAPVTIKLLNMKVEIADAINKMVPEFEKENPGIKLSVETVGGGADYKAHTMAKFQSGEAPDIWNNTGFSDLDFWFEKVEDLSDQPWVKDMIDGADVPIKKDGKIYGLPLAVEGFGFAYNKALFTKAGITTLPNTLTSLEDACKKLQAAGIQPFSNSYAEDWVLGMHNLNVFYAQQPDAKKFIADVAAGKTKFKDNPAKGGWVKLLDLTVKYGQKNPTTAGDYASSVAAFSSGKAAMIQQGNWIQPDLDKVDANLNIGFIPMPISDTAEGKIFAGIPNYWVINKGSKNKAEAKVFLNWLVTSETGKRYITEEFKALPAFKTIKSTKYKGLNASLVEYTSAGKTYPWLFPLQPDGSFSLIGKEMMKYLAGQIKADDMCDAIDKIIIDRAAASKK